MLVWEEGYDGSAGVAVAAGVAAAAGAFAAVVPQPARVASPAAVMAAVPITAARLVLFMRSSDCLCVAAGSGTGLVRLRAVLLAGGPRRPSTSRRPSAPGSSRRCTGCAGVGHQRQRAM